MAHGSPWAPCLDPGHHFQKSSSTGPRRRVPQSSSFSNQSGRGVGPWAARRLWDPLKPLPRVSPRPPSPCSHIVGHQRVRVRWEAIGSCDLPRLVGPWFSFDRLSDSSCVNRASTAELVANADFTVRRPVVVAASHRSRHITNDELPDICQTPNLPNPPNPALVFRRPRLRGTPHAPPTPIRGRPDS